MSKLAQRTLTVEIGSALAFASVGGWFLWRRGLAASALHGRDADPDLCVRHGQREATLLGLDSSVFETERAMIPGSTACPSLPA